MKRQPIAEVTEREYGDGTVTVLPGGKYRVRVYVPGRHGKGVQASKTITPPKGVGKKELRALIDGAVAELKSKARRGASNAATVNAIIEEYIGVKTEEWAPRTLETVQRVQRLVREALIGTLRLDQITTKDVDAFYRTLPAKSRRRYHAVLSGAFNQAVVWGDVPANPALQAKLPAVGPTEVGAVSPDHVAAFLSAAQAVDEGMALLFTIGSMTAMRRGELCGLQWADLDFENGVFHVQRAVHRVGRQRVGLGPPKAKRDRYVPLPPPLAPVLKAWREAEGREMAALGRELSPDAFIVSKFPDRTRPLNPDLLNAFARRVCTQAGLAHLRPHQLRHGVATYLLANGYDAVTVAGILGNSVKLTLDTYGHSIDERRRSAAAAMGQAITLPSATPALPR